MMFCLSYKTIRGLTKKGKPFFFYPAGLRPAQYFNYYEQIKDRYSEIGPVV